MPGSATTTAEENTPKIRSCSTGEREFSSTAAGGWAYQRTGFSARMHRSAIWWWVEGFVILGVVVFGSWVWLMAGSVSGRFFHWSPVGPLGGGGWSGSGCSVEGEDSGVEVRQVLLPGPVVGQVEFQAPC